MYDPQRLRSSQEEILELLISTYYWNSKSYFGQLVDVDADKTQLDKLQTKVEILVEDVQNPMFSIIERYQHQKCVAEREYKGNKR